jgi:hypothetical protein
MERDKKILKKWIFVLIPPALLIDFAADHRLPKLTGFFVVDFEVCGVLSLRVK